MDRIQERSHDTEVDQESLTKRVYGFLQQKADSPKALKDSNVILLMGGETLDEVTKKAAELWFEDKSRVIVTTPDKGYYSGKYTEPESERYFNRLRQLEVPENKILHNPVSRNTVDEFMNFTKLLDQVGIVPKKVVIVDRPVHQKRAFLNALKLQPKLTFVNAPSNEQFDLSVPDHQLRCVSEIERLISYRDLIRPTIPMEILEDTAKLRGILRDQGVYTREKHPRHLYSDKPGVMPPWEKPWETED